MDGENVYIIGHSGTNGATDIDDDANIFLATALEQYEVAKEFIQCAFKHISEQSDEAAIVEFTGHSLGAALAVLSAADFRLPAISFDDPGVGKQEIVQKNLEYVQENVVTYNALPNLVNTGGYHEARLFSIYIPLKNTQTGNRLYDENFATQPSFPHYSGIYTTLSQHSIEQIADAFDEDGAHVFTDYSNMLQQWPSGVTTGHGGLDYYQSIRYNPFYWHQYIKSCNYKLGITDYRNSPITKELLTRLHAIDNYDADQHQRKNIFSDENSNSVWGTDAFGCDIFGEGNDDFHLYGANNIVTCTGGNNEFSLHGMMQTIDDYIFKTYNIGKTIISSPGNDEIYLLNKNISGRAIYSEKHSKNSKIGDVYLLMTDENDGFMAVHQGNLLKIFLQEADLSDADACNNYLELRGFEWGNYGIDLEQDPSKYEVIFATKENNFINSYSANKEVIILNIADNVRIDLLPDDPVKIISKLTTNLEVYDQSNGELIFSEESVNFSVPEDDFWHKNLEQLDGLLANIDRDDAATSTEVMGSHNPGNLVEEL